VIREKYPAARLVICADDDRWKPEVGNVGVSKATAAAQAVGAALAVPDVAGIEGKPTDFNDVAVARGLGAVLAQLNAVLDPTTCPEQPKPSSAPLCELMAPTYPAPIGSVEMARDAVARVVGDFFAGLHAWTVEQIKAELADAPAPPPPQVGVQVGVGIGKTAAARHEIVRLILTAKKRATDPSLSEVERAAWKQMARGAVAGSRKLCRTGINVQRH
jgi:hypothetical protein